MVSELGDWKQSMPIDRELAVTQLWLLLAGYRPEVPDVPAANCEALLHILYCPSALKSS